MVWASRRFWLSCSFLLVPLGLLVWMSVLALVRADERNQFQQRAAQAVAVLDAAASGIVITEGVRPPQHWRPVVTRIGNPSSGMEPMLQHTVSPLVHAPTAPVLLYFSLHADGESQSGVQVRSPHMRSGNEPPGLQALAIEAQAASTRELFAQLQQGAQDLWQAMPPAPEASRVPLRRDLASPAPGAGSEYRQRFADTVQARNVGAYGADDSPASDSLPWRQGTAAVVEPMRALPWLEDVVLMRWVVDEEGPQVQGVVLDMADVSALLLLALDADQSGTSLRLSREGDDPLLRLHALPLTLVLAPQAGSLSPPARRMLGWIVLSAILVLGSVLVAMGVLWRGAQRRASFVSAVTHELRSPLTALRLHADLLGKASLADNPQQRQSIITTIQAQGQRLAALIDNVLDYARLEQRRPPQCVPIDMVAFLRQHQPTWQQRCASAGLQLCLIVPENTLPKVRAEHDGLQRIVDNLIENACKYAADSGPLEISLRAAGTRQVLEIRDYGPGLAGKSLPRAFERSAEMAAGQAPGIGLGLVLCRRLAKAMGGRLRFQSLHPGLRVSLSLRECTT